MKYHELVKKLKGDRCCADMAVQMILNRWYYGLGRFEGMCEKLEEIGVLEKAKNIGTLTGHKWRKIKEIELPK